MLIRTLVTLLPLALVCCTGPSPSGSLLRLTAEPPGANCPAGGTAIQVGTDADGDGQLEDSEVTGSKFVCNGQDGAQGLQGPQGDPGPQGPQGPSGFVCQSMVYGSAVVLNTSDLVTLYCATEITGNLELGVQGYSTVSVPSLVTIGGDLTIEGADLTTLSFPKLKTIQGRLIVFAPKLPVCQVEGLLAQLDAPPSGGVLLEAADDTVTCP